MTSPEQPAALRERLAGRRFDPLFANAALNQLMRSYATRHAGDGHTKLLIDPGHNRTRLGGPDAPGGRGQKV
ncbi:hypothetical protein B0I32_113150 [Nonomuraea fuscirosea]|uniref:Uncharacterized protein n=1 Tax=Nonomuraea fuscirosea TaxID=1291556 RepID=A0A2T0MU21_9ACTN|nr:hypothetical protein [Nonomuraea fuscirosea]PRX62197.1 hypothetical protein B0I32_113150 [Nonomuraea fuscirosea]